MKFRSLFIALFLATAVTFPNISTISAASSISRTIADKHTSGSFIPVHMAGHLAGKLVPTEEPDQVLAADTTPPNITWTAPVGDGLIYYTGDEQLTLAVDAVDNVAVSAVYFLRWDTISQTWIDIGTDSSSPYSHTLDTSSLRPGYNQVNADVVDTSGNWSTKYIWVYHLPVLTVTKVGSGNGTVTSSPSGINCGSTCSSAFDDNTSVTLAATQASGSTFTGWSGEGCSGTDTCTVTMDAAKSVTAYFEDTTPPSISWIAPIGNGQVYDVGNQIIQLEVDATDNIGITQVVFYRWDHPNQESIQIGMDDSPPYRVNFDASTLNPGWNQVDAVAFDGNYAASEMIWLNHLVKYSLSVSKSGTGSGSVTSDPPGINCGSTCSYNFDYNTSVTLAATPTAPATFIGWNGAGCSGTGTCTVTMDAAKSVTATFSAPGNQTLTVGKAGTGSGTVTSNPSGINCGSTCSYDFTYNTSVTLTATPTAPATFGGWSGVGCSGIGTCTVTMSSVRSVTAIFNAPGNQSLTVRKSGTGSGTVTSNPSGINCGSTCSYDFPFNTSVTLTAAGAIGSTFTGWSGVECSGTGICAVTMNAVKSITASFEDTTSPNISWIAPIGNEQVYDVADLTIQLEVNASDNLGVTQVVFSRWDYINLTFIEIGNVHSQPYRINFDTSTLLPDWNYVQAIAYDAAGNSISEYIYLNHLVTYKLSVSKVGIDSGMVTSDPSGINCGSTCLYAFAKNTSVTLTATPTAPATFIGWNGAGCSGTGTCTVTMDAAKSVTATFSAPGNQTLTVGKAGTGSGTVTSNPSGINCGSTCSYDFTYNTSVTLTATPTAPATFGGWSGAGCSGIGTCTVTMDTAKSVTATFAAPVSQTLTVNKSGTGSGTVTSNPSGINCGLTCSYDLPFNTSVTLTATPAAQSSFGGWSGLGCSGLGTCTVTMDISKSVSAAFTPLTITNKPWTFLLYLAADNNLYNDLTRAITDLEALTANPNVNIVVLYDGDRTNDSWRFLVQPGGNYSLGVNKWYLGEVNTGNPQTLSDFITWGMQTYPAENYYLSIADHGRGTSGVAWDYTSLNDYLTTGELRMALNTATNSGLWKIDVLHFDACLMGMLEVAYQMKDYASYLVASENLGWSLFAYSNYAQSSAANAITPYEYAQVAAQVTSTTTPRQLAISIVDAYFNHLALQNNPRTIAALDLSQSVPVTQALDALTGTLRTNLGSIKNYVQNTRSATQKFDSRDYFQITQDDEYVDLYHLAEKLKQYVPNASVQAAAQGVMDAITNGFVIAEHHQSGYWGGLQDVYWDLDNAHGVSLYFPPRSGSNDYNAYIGHQKFQFTIDNQWDNFLSDYFGAVGLPPENGGDSGIPPMLSNPYSIYLPTILR